MKANVKALVELAKSAGRFLWFGFIGLVVTLLTGFLTDGAVLGAQVEIFGQVVAVGPLLVALIGLAIKTLDRYVYLNKDIKSNGLAPEFLQK